MNSLRLTARNCMVIAPLIAACLLPYATVWAAGSEPEIPISGPTSPSLSAIDDLMISFLRQNHVPGASVAITRRGHLVYSRGFGWADIKEKRPVEPDSLFRIASISKSLTAAAILKLAESRKLDLNQSAFSYLGLSPFLLPGHTVDSRMSQISIWHLLHHSGGFDRDVSFDPMFRSVDIAHDMHSKPPATQDQIIRYMMGRSLDFDPGTRYAYSNFGYCVLGRVIEKASGQTYGQFVTDEILAPLKIQRMSLGHTLPNERVSGEVSYYSVRSPGAYSSVFGDKGKVPAPYGCFYIEAMDSHGGWLSSAVDLVKFANTFDNPEKCPILKKESIAKLIERPDITGYDANNIALPVYYGCGWFVRILSNGRINTWHSGLLEGTSTFLARWANGIDCAVLFNCDTDPNKKPLSNLIDPLIGSALGTIKEWPDSDLFQDLAKQ